MSFHMKVTIMLGEGMLQEFDLQTFDDFRAFFIALAMRGKYPQSAPILSDLFDMYRERSHGHIIVNIPLDMLITLF